MWVSYTTISALYGKIGPVRFATLWAITISLWNIFSFLSFNVPLSLKKSSWKKVTPMTDGNVITVFINKSSLFWCWKLTICNRKCYVLELFHVKLLSLYRVTVVSRDEPRPTPPPSVSSQVSSADMWTDSKLSESTAHSRKKSRYFYFLCV